MKTDLDEVIELYELEKASLEKAIADYLSEGDYLYANHHQKALIAVNGKLNQFYRMKKPYQDEVARYEYMVENFKRQKEPDLELISSFYNKWFEEQGEKIKRLEQEFKQPYFNDDQQIDDALFRLVGLEWKAFKLYIRQEPELCLEFKLTRDNQFIEIKILSAEELYDDDEFGEIGPIKGLGFRFDDNNIPVYRSLTENFKDALAIKNKLSVLIYDVFHFNRVHDTARLTWE